MKKIIKYTISALIISLVLAFAGCAEFNIEGKITEDNTVSFSYVLKFTGMDKEEDLNYDQLELFLLDVQNYWEAKGVDATMNLYDDGMELIGLMEKKCETREEAFNTLYEYMTNEITVFDNVSLSYTGDYYEVAYNVSGSVDLTGIMDEQIYEAHPEIVIEDVDEFMQNLSCNITFSLPYNDSVDAVEIIQNETAISFTDTAAFNIDGVIKNNDLLQEEKDLLTEKGMLEADIKKYRLFTYIGAGLLALVIIAIVVLNILGKKKNKNADSEQEVKPSEDAAE